VHFQSDASWKWGHPRSAAQLLKAFQELRAGAQLVRALDKKNSFDSVSQFAFFFRFIG
jgi:hypothetical protein